MAIEGSGPFTGQGARQFTDFAEDSFSWKYLERPVFRDFLSDRIKSSRYNDILDVGSGSGRMGRFLVSLGADPARITGIDKSSDIIEEAKKINPEMRFIEGDIANHGFLKEHYDIVTAHMVLQHLSDEELNDALRNISSALRPEGMLVFMVPHPIRQVRHNLTQYFDHLYWDDETPFGITVPYYHRTVADYFQATSTDANLSVRQMVEPELPIISIGESHNEYYRYKKDGPSRLAIQAIKS